MLNIVSYAGTCWDSSSLHHCSENSPKISLIRDFITKEDQTQLLQPEPEDSFSSLTTSPFCWLLSVLLCLQASRTMVWAVPSWIIFIPAVQLRDDTRSHKCLLEMRTASRSRSRNIKAKQLGLAAGWKCTEDTKHQSCKFSEKIFLILTSILLQSNIWKEM